MHAPTSTPETAGSLFDVPRHAQGRRGRRLLLVAALLLPLLVGVTFALSRLRDAAPSVERSTLWTDTVQRGELVREVRGPGTLVPEEVRWITADTAGRVERRPLRPGVEVRKETVLLELSNPDVMLQALDAERQLAQAETDRLTLRLAQGGQLTTERSQLHQLRSESADAARRAEADRGLLASGALSQVEAQQAQEKSQALLARLGLQEARVAELAAQGQEQLAAQAAQVARLRAVVQFRRRLVDSLQVRAGWDGVLSEMPLELGQWVTPGALLAKVVKPGALKALVRIPETQARDVAPGQAVRVDTHNGLARGRVRRVAPGASQGAVEVEVELLGELPRGARPDLQIDGTVELERLPSVLHVSRPAGAQADASLQLFRLRQGASEAERVQVQFGRTSVGAIEVKSGLAEGDTVVLSDLSAIASARLRVQ